VVVDNPAAVAALIDAIRVSTVSPLQEQVHRFTGCSKLLGRFADLCAAWEAGRMPNARQITDTVNELRIALALIQDAKCKRLEYEARIDGTDKTIDFTLTNTDGKRIFYDVKTVLPEEGDRWALYQNATANGWFSPGTKLDLDEEFGGPELAHYAFATRDKFIEYSLELEQKIRSVAKDGETYFRIVFCGDNFRWHQSDLEDFVDTYFGRPTPWDHLASMQKHMMQEKGWTWDRSIDDFCYFQRGPSQPAETNFICDLKGPGFPERVRSRQQT
jgi:hypothetical protein